MIVDSSALLCVLFREEGHERMLERLVNDPGPAVGAPTLAETAIVLTARLGPSARGVLERFLDEVGIQEVPFGELHWREAVEAYRRFGKGRHPAALDFGDCLTYAVAALAGEPLLFVGDDFTRTDLEVVR
ncbi:MAG: type II toxin-antitoxin system VapC family toxin [Gemmatimonadetes bacterium]|nr:type II toxin-antitoxin system VapC family toxin [Gemmatimonadota bacterium]MBT8404872.1 type II toxin-antitoxin system VapC family toxin [Gemmatimonadota bacterium]NNF37801.1 type II toxin-antitoxin system VapC family toxin [Gemmatimonadota bacterium]NNK62237.1 type II toxin-antitoxin system VapC family toxin [Gemmatimonadota bacterium]